jgi:outer membrane protein assembly factor BamB
MNKNDKTHFRYITAQRIALASALFAVILSILLIANYIQTTSVDPLNSKALNQLMLELREDGDNDALKEQIRALDLLARKAYFTNQWQIRTGGFMLFAFVLAFLASLKYLSSLKRRFPDFEEEHESGALWEHNLLAKKYLIYGGLGLFALAFILGILSDSDLSGTGSGNDAETASFPSIDEIRANWPNFRGPGGNGHAYSANSPTQWDGPSGENIVWKTELPVDGYNSPVIWGNKIFLSGADDENQTVYCIDADTGAILWETMLDHVPGSPEDKPDVTEDTGYAAPTMATDGKNVFVLFGTGDTGCFDFDGTLIWSKNLGVPDNHYGHSSSLITYRGLLLIQYDQNSGGHLIALRTDSGKLAYDQPRDIEMSWASPILVNTGSRDELILNSNPYVMSHDPATGRELWRVDCMMGEVAPSLAFADGMIFAVNEYAVLAGITLESTPETAWETEDDLSEVSSPVANSEFVIVATSYGTVSCFDAKTGERYWYQDFSKGFYSSPVLVGETVYLMDMTGAMYIFNAAKEFNLINKCELGERAVAVPAFMDDRIYIRGFENLYCIGE